MLDIVHYRINTSALQDSHQKLESFQSRDVRQCSSSFSADDGIVIDMHLSLSFGLNVVRSRGAVTSMMSRRQLRALWRIQCTANRIKIKHIVRCETDKSTWASDFIDYVSQHSYSCTKGISEFVPQKFRFLSFSFENISELNCRCIIPFCKLNSQTIEYRNQQTHKLTYAQINK